MSPNVVLALGGGGARGLAHLGVLEVLGDAGIRPDRIVGVSIGSIVGAVCAFESDVRAVQKKTLGYLTSESFQRHQSALYGARRGSKGGTNGNGSGRSFLWFDRVKEYLVANRLVHRVMIRPSFLPAKLLQDVVEALVPDADIADASIPLTIVAVDLKSGRSIALERGPLRAAVMGSASLPGIFPPVPFGDALLTDIGVFASLPTTVAQQYRPAPLVAVDVSPELAPIKTCATALDVMMRMEEIGGTLFRDHVLSLADIVIRPDVGALEWSDFSTVEGVIEEGRAAARERLELVRAACGLPAAPDAAVREAVSSEASRLPAS